MRLRAVFASLAGLVAGLAAGAACAADASGTFAAFQQLCLAPHAHAAQILAQADAAGWTPGPDSMAAAPQFKAMTEFGVRTRAAGAVQDFLIAGSGPIGEFNGLKVSADLCLLAAKGVDGAAIAAEVGAWVGVPPDPKRTQPGDVTYSFTEDAHGRVAVINPTDEEAKALVKAGKVHLVIVQFADDHAMVGYFTPRL
jgi:hypothetical protein